LRRSTETGWCCGCRPDRPFGLEPESWESRSCSAVLRDACPESWNRFHSTGRPDPRGTCRPPVSRPARGLLPQAASTAWPTCRYPPSNALLEECMSPSTTFGRSASRTLRACFVLAAGCLVSAAADWSLRPDAFAAETSGALLACPALADDGVSHNVREAVRARKAAMAAQRARHRERRRREYPEWARRRFPQPGVQRVLPRESDLPSIEELEAHASQE
jgi:hypothetical protein